MASISQKAPGPLTAAPATARPPARVVIENVLPQLDSGRFPVKRILGDEIIVTADIHADGHDVLAAVLRRHDDRAGAATLRPLEIVVDREAARFSAWYEMFPRSAGGLRQAEARLPEIARMGFDVVYLPPIHPIGRSFRKGPNNSPRA